MMDAYYYQGPYPDAKPSFQFDLSVSAAKHNYNVMRDHNFSLDDAIGSQANTPLRFGSEFKPLHLLKRILQHHPLWEFTSRYLQDGASYPLREISSEDRDRDLASALSRGNHNPQ
jgi:hypothetical protein